MSEFVTDLSRVLFILFMILAAWAVTKALLLPLAAWVLTLPTLGLTLNRSRERRRAARRAAESAGLADVREGKRGTPEDPLVRGRSGDLIVSLLENRRGQRLGTQIEVVGRRLGRRLRLIPHDGTGAGWGSEREVETGDASFDQEFSAHGEAPFVLAILGPETRRLLGALTGKPGAAAKGAFPRAEASLDGGRLRVWLPDGLSGKNIERTTEVLPRVLEVAGRLVKPRDVAMRIAENLRIEAEAGVRLRCLRTLARYFSGHPATREALLAAREDADPEVRLDAAIALGGEGRELVLATARGESAPDETSARAVAALGVSLAAGDATDLFEAALRDRRLATARECLRVLGEGRGDAAVRMLAKVLAIEKGELAAAAAKALGATRDPSAESALVSALDDAEEEVRAASARALGRVGTVAAVQPLKALEERDASCRAAAHRAIADIQSRLTGAEHGQLSLAGGESGELSIAEGEEGRLSIVSSPEGPSAEAGDEGPAVTADPSRPGQMEVAQDDEVSTSAPGRLTSARMTGAKE